MIFGVYRGPPGPRDYWDGAFQEVFESETSETENRHEVRQFLPVKAVPFNTGNGTFILGLS